MPQAMKIPDAKAAANKEWEKLEKIPARQMDKVKSEKDVILEAQEEKKKVQFAALMDIRHLKNAELEPKHPKHKGRVVLRGDIVKDDTGAYAVFHRTSIVSLASDCCKSNGRYCEITRMRWTSRRRSKSLHPGKNGGRSKVAKKSKVRMFIYIYIYM